MLNVCACALGVCVCVCVCVCECHPRSLNLTSPQLSCGREAMADVMNAVWAGDGIFL